MEGQCHARRATVHTNTSKPRHAIQQHTDFVDTIAANFECNHFLEIYLCWFTVSWRAIRWIKVKPLVLTSSANGCVGAFLFPNNIRVYTIFSFGFPLSFFTFRNNSSCHFVLNLPHHNWLRRNVDVFVQKEANILFQNEFFFFILFISHICKCLCMCVCMYQLILFTHILRRSLNNEYTNIKKTHTVFCSPHSCVLFSSSLLSVSNREQRKPARHVRVCVQI